MESFKAFLKKIKWQNYLIAAILIFVGIFFVAAPSDSLIIVCRVIGALLLVAGIVALIVYFSGGMIFGSYAFLLGITLSCIGVYFLIRPNVVSNILTIVFGIAVMIDGFIKIQDAVDCARAKVKNWWILLIVSVLTIALGVFILLDPFTSQEALMIYAGVSLIVDGVLDIVTTAAFGNKVRKTMKKAEALSGKEVQEEEKEINEDKEVKEE